MLLHLRSCVVRLTLAANGSSGSRYMSYRTSGALIKKEQHSHPAPLNLIPTGSLCGRPDTSVARFTAYGVPRVWLKVD